MNVSDRTKATVTTLDVGVVVPVRDGIEHLPGTLESLLSQRPLPKDIVVVNGRTDDRCLSIAKAFPRVRVVDQTTPGLGAARNQGVAVVAGDAIAFCDVDDRWSEGSLAIRLAHLEGASDCHAVIGHLTTFPLEGSVVPDLRGERLGSPMPAYTPGGLLILRSAFLTLGAFDEDLAIGTDTDWFVRLATSGLQLRILDDIVLHKGVRLHSLSTNVEAYRRDLLTIVRAHVSRTRKG